MKHLDKTKTDTTKRIKSLRTKDIDVETLFKSVLQGSKTALGQAITLIESRRTADFEKSELLISMCLKSSGNSVRIGITGVPGVGKSTFIEAFGTHLTNLGKKVAVLAVDPSSSITKGSILGDKTRMEALVKDPYAFIRPSPASDSLGGVTRKTRETIILCEAAGYDSILVETVGVGQSETAVHGMVDFFLLLKLAGAGDELQGIKRGIVEMADAIIINKADGNNLKNVQMAVAEFKRALHLYPPKENHWIPKVVSCSALEQRGIDNVWKLVSEFVTLTKENLHFERHRALQNKKWFLQTVEDLLKHQFYEDNATKTLMEHLTHDVMGNIISPYKAAQKLIASKK